MRTREEHLAWCKERAHRYVDADELQHAVNSMCSDLEKHEETSGGRQGALMMMGSMDASAGDIGGVRRWINGFN